MYAKAQQQLTRVATCAFCKSIGKSDTNHYIHKTKNPNSMITCPVLLMRVCLNCPGRNHTVDRCPKMNTVQVCFSASSTGKTAEKTVSNEKKATKNRFAGLEDDSDEEEEATMEPEEKPTNFKSFEEPFVDLEMGISFNIDTLVSLSDEERINYIGEELYSKIVLTEPKRAGMITGMLLEMDITELLYMLETPDLFRERIADCVRVLEQPE
jgi:hypothetical protein